jgi:PAS domain S-box-containing protein
MSNKILIVEDDSVFRNYLFMVLKGEYDVTVAANPIQALDFLSREIFDLIITDLRMPEMDGREFVEKVHSEIFPGLPVIVVTAFEDDWPEEEGILSHTFTFLRKGGFLPSELKSLVEKAIGKPLTTESAPARLSEIHFKDVLDNLPDAVIVTDMDLKPFYTNRRFGTFTGLVIKDMSGSFLNILSSESRQTLTEAANKSAENWQADLVLEIKCIDSSMVKYNFALRYMKTQDADLMVFAGNPAQEAHDSGITDTHERLQGIINELEETRTENKAVKADFDRIAADSRGILLWLDGSFGCIYINPDVERILGYKPDELKGAGIPWKRIIHPDDVHVISDILTATEQGIGKLNGEAKAYSRTGLLVYLAWNAALSYKPDGSLAGVDVIAEDITQRIITKNELLKAGKRLEEARESMQSAPDERCRLIVEGSNNVIFTLDEDSRILYVNRRGLTVLGAVEDDIISRPFQEFISDPISVTRFEAAMIKLSEGKDPGLVNISIDASHGRSVWGINMWAMGSSPSRIEYAGIARDMTSEVSNYKKLKLLANIEQYSADAIIGYDLERRIISWNSGASMMFGWSEEEILGNYSFTTIVPEERKRESDDVLKEVLEKGYVRDLETIRKTKTGEMLNVSLSMTTLRDEVGKAFGFSIIMKDITRQKKMEAALIQSERLAAMGKLSASIAHEINNPLYGIKSCLKHVLNAEETKKIDSQFVRLAIKETDRIAELIRNMKTFYQPTDAEIFTTDINEIIREILTFNRKYLEENKVKLELDLAECPYVLAVPEQIKQVFINLMTNAAEAMPGGGTLRVSTLPGIDGKSVIIRFEDNGVGIAKEDIPRLFDMFYSKKPHVKGVGLGLSVSYGIIKRHGGTIDVESDPATGTGFKIVLPVKPGWERQLKLELK